MNYDVASVREYSDLTFDNAELSGSEQPKSYLQFGGQPDWSIIIPFHNEEAHLVEAIRSAALQAPSFDLILVDNGSTDASAPVAEAECARLALPFGLFEEPRRGKVHALARGLQQVNTRFVATFDADTIYPSHYLAAATRLFHDANNVCAQAFYVRKDWSQVRRRLASAKMLAASSLLPHQCHTGGAGQVFRTDTLREAGGFDAIRWNLILEDHEIVHRLTRFGRAGCGPNFWCCPGRREQDHPSTRWTFTERLRYHFTPAARQSRFFYEYLAPRLEARANA